MKISDQRLKQIILEEVEDLEEGLLDRIRARMSGAGAALGEIPAAFRGAAAGFMGRGGPDVEREGDAYSRGKAEKILQLHKRKFVDLFEDVAEDLEELVEDMVEDLQSLGIAEEISLPIARRIFSDVNSTLGQKMSSYLADIPAGTDPEEEVPRGETRMKAPVRRE